MVLEQDLMRFQSSNPPSFWMFLKQQENTPKAEKGNSWNNTFPIHFPESSGEASRKSLAFRNWNQLCWIQLCPGVSMGTNSPRASSWWVTWYFFLDSWGNDGSKFLHWLREYLCVVMLYHGSHPPQVVPKSSKSFTNLDFCERYEANSSGPLLKGKQRFSPPGSAKT